MDIKWFGKGCFRIKERSTIAFTDPYPLADGSKSRNKADVVTFSAGQRDKKALDTFSTAPYVITRPGEYEVSGLFVTAVAPARAQKPNVLTLFHFEDITVCHLGALDHVLGQNEVEQLGAVDILLVPAGGPHLVNAAQASEVISLLEPSLIIPMYYSASEPELLERFLKEMGSSPSAPLDELRISKSGLPEESQILLLNPAA